MTQRPFLVDRKTAIDGRWFDRIAANGAYSTEMYAFLGPSPGRLAAAYKAFAGSGYRDSPSMLPDDVHAEGIAAEKDRLLDLLADIEATEADEMVRSIYMKRISEMVANIALYESALRNDTGEYAATNEQIYGLPDRTLFDAACAEIRGWLRDWAAEDAVHGEAYQSAYDLLPSARTAAGTLRPDATVFVTQRNLHFNEGGFYNQLFRGLDMPSGMVTEHDGDPLVRQLLANLGTDFTLLDSPDSYWGVRYSLHRVVRPASYSLTAEEFVAVVGHEVGSHLLEWLNGMRQPFRLLSLGLDGLEKGNEGRALLREQVVYPSWEAFAGTWRWYEILRRHLAISLAVGLDGPRRSFAEVFSIINAVDWAWALSHGSPDNVDSREAIRRQTWEIVARVLKGTDGMGGAYYKDIVYLEGNMACWRLAAEQPAIIRFGDEGKVNIADPTHLGVLEVCRAA